MAIFSLSFYTYGTFRFFSFIIPLSLIFLHRKKFLGSPELKKGIIIFLLLILPFVFYYIFNAENAFKRSGDTIIFNPPYLPEDPNDKDVALDGGKKGYELICRFLNEANPYIKPKTKILLVFSSLTGKDTIDRYLIKKRFKFRELEKENIFFEGIFVYLIENE